MKKIILLCGLMFFLMSVSAQEKSDSTVYTKGVMSLKLSEGWFIGASGGAQTYWDADDHLAPFSERISPMFSVYAGKWLLPFIGLRLGYDGVNANGFSKGQTGYSVGAQREDGLFENSFGYNNLHIDLLYNLSENVCRENPKRVYSFIPYAGLGLFQMYKKGSTSSFFNGKDNEFSFNVGIINQFRITQNFSANVELQAIILRGGISQSVRSGGGNPLVDVLTPLKVGVVYRFGKTRSKRGVEVGYVEALKSDLRRAVADKENIAAVLPSKEKEIASGKAEINTLKNALNDLKSAKRSDALKENAIKAKFVIFFGSSSHFLSSKDKVTLRYASEAIKSTPNQKYLISAYADPQTGNPHDNQELTKLRANAIYNLLVDQLGVNKDQLIMKPNGQNNPPHENFRLNRVVVIEPMAK